MDKLNLDITPQKLTYALFGILVLILGGFGYVHYQLSAQVEDDIATLEKEKVNQAVAEERIDQLKSLKHRLSEIEDIKQDIDQILPSTKQQAQIIGQLATVASEAGFNIDNISFENTGGIPSKLTQTIESKMSGLRVTPVRFAIKRKKYSQLLAFLQDLENLQRFTQVDSLSITSGGTVEGSSENLLNFNMTLHIFMQTPKSDTEKSKSETNNSQGQGGS